MTAETQGVTVAGDASRFGVFLPSYIWAGDGQERVEGLLDFAREVERLGFDSIFITDHVIAAKHFYDVSWLDSLTTLTFVAAVTRRVRLGTSILILPLRHPVILAKQIATLEYLSQERYIIGGGVGWYEPEFEAVATHKRERGRRSDEVLDILAALLTQEHVSYDGEFYKISDVTIDPRPSRMPPVWIGGGSQLASDKSPEPPRFAESVMARVARSDGWIPRPTSPPEQIASDWQALSSYLRDHGREPRDVAVVHENFLHYVPSSDRERVLREQHAAYGRVMSEARGDDYLESVYLFGTPDEIVAKLQARVDAGVEYFVLHTMTPDPSQLESWLRDVIPNVRFPADARHPARVGVPTLR
ncbi:MAG: TIGR03619 family F420-dependent LLM class oxidoreductase [Chloroflexota bacterium]